MTVRLVAVAVERGYEAHHVVRLNMSGADDWDIAFHALEHDFVLVTNNAVDFRVIYAKHVLHPDLVILVPNVKAHLQCQGIKPPKRA